MNNTLARKIVPIVVIALLVVGLAYAASNIVKPHEQTPIKSIFPKPESQVIFPDGPVIGAWVWQYPTQLKDKISELLSVAQAEKISTVYINIDEYIDIYEMKDGKVKEMKMTEYLESIKHIISIANTKNIKVHALSGNPAYSYDSHEYIPPILLKNVFEFNQKNPDTQFEGVQFDIEFYEDDRYWSDVSSYTQNYLKLIKTLTEQTVDMNEKYSQNLQLGFSIPFWFDKPNDYFSKPIFPDIVATLSKLPNSYLIIMAYRNVIMGEGSVMSVAADELSLTEKTSVKVIIGQEIVKNKDIKITHYGKSKDEIKTDLVTLIDTAKSYPSFQGIAIHDLETFMNTR